MTREKICGIYKIKNIIDNKVYIGSSKNIKERWYRHKKDLRKNKHHSVKLQRAWNKYGEENFKFEIIIRCDNAELLSKEQFYIDKFDSFNNGYNSQPFADRHEFSDETKSKIGKSSKGRNAGENNNTTKINEFIAKKIISDLLNPNLLISEIAKIYNVSIGIINCIYYKRSWTYLTDKICFPKRTENANRQKSKLNDDIVKNIIQDIIKHVSYKDIMNKYDIQRYIINNIKFKKSWKHLTKDIIF
jgi:group I intron endonuclease